MFQKMCFAIDHHLV